MIELKNITKIYGRGENAFRALDNVSLSINKGELAAIIGPSGSGKSTLLHILGCLDTQSGGTYLFENAEVTEKNKLHIRRDKLGFVFQSFNLVPHMTALQNVIFPLSVSAFPPKMRRELAQNALCDVGLSDFAEHYPRELSGGQMQRVAIARALVRDPELILADEPCGNLDPRASAQITELLFKLPERGKTVVIITHDINCAAQMPRVIKIEKGVLTNGKTR